MVKNIAALMLALWAGVAMAADKPEPSAAEKDIRAVIAQVAKGYEKFDAPMVAQMYADDALWQNPFGVRLHGKAEIEKFLTALFKRDAYRNGKPDNNFRITDIVLRAPDVAVVWSEESGVSDDTNQSDKKIGIRKSHYMEVLVHSKNGWRITDDIIMDEQ